MSTTTKAKKPAVIKARSKATGNAAPPSSPPQEDTSRDLKMPAENGKSHARMVADLVTTGDVLNATTAQRFVRTELGQVDLSQLAISLREAGKAVNAGDLSAGERMLYAQAVTLNSIFTELASRAHSNIGHFIDPVETYTRLALKAQSQCRATWETLAAMKNPPVVFTRQMNVANNQQINNGTPPGAAPPSPTRTPETQSQPNELLEDATHGSTQLDTGTTTQAGRGHQELAPVGSINRPAH